MRFSGEAISSNGVWYGSSRSRSRSPFGSHIKQALNVEREREEVGWWGLVVDLGPV